MGRTTAFFHQMISGKITQDTGKKAIIIGFTDWLSGHIGQATIWGFARLRGYGGLFGKVRHAVGGDGCCGGRNSGMLASGARLGEAAPTDSSDASTGAFRSPSIPMTPKCSATPSPASTASVKPI